MIAGDLGPILLSWINFNLTISNRMVNKVFGAITWGQITYPFPNFNNATVEVWKRIGNFIPHFVMHVVIIQTGSQVTMLMKGHFLDDIDSVWHYVAKWRSKVSSIIVNIGSRDGLLSVACFEATSVKCES